MNLNHKVAKIIGLVSFASLLTLLGQCAWADIGDQTDSPEIQSGVYVNGGILSSWPNFKLNRQVTIHGVNTAPPPNLTFSYKKRRIGGTAAVGYQFVYNNFYFAPEFQMDFSNPKFDVSQTLKWPQVVHTFTGGMTLKHPMSFNALIGWKINPATVIYGRVGAVYTKASYRFAKAAPVYEAENVGSKKLWGRRFGFGIGRQLSDHLMLRADYMYTKYNNVNFNTRLAPLSRRNPNIYSVSHRQYQLHNQAVMLTLSYVF